MMKITLDSVKKVESLEALKDRCTKEICIVGKCGFLPHDRCFKVGIDDIESIDETKKGT